MSNYMRLAADKTAKIFPFSLFAYLTAHGTRGTDEPPRLDITHSSSKLQTELEEKPLVKDREFVKTWEAKIS
eukprot:g40944.t1